MQLFRRLPPGPGSSLLLKARRARHDPIGLLDELFRKYGDLVGVQAGRRVAFLVNDPTIIRSILVEKAPSFVRGIVSPTTYHLMGGSVFVAEGKAHEEKRAAMHGFFQHDHLAAYVDLAAARTCELTRSWKAGEVLDIGEAMNGLALRVSAESLFSVRDATQVQAIGRALLGASGGWERTLNPLAPVLERLPTLSNQRIRASTEDLFRIIDRLVEDRMAAPGKHRDILDLVIQSSSHGSGGGRYSARDLRGEAIDMLIGSHGTVAYALAWTVHELATNPAEQELAARPLAGLGREGRLSFADLPQLRSARSVFREGLRLHPPAWCVLRRALEPVEVGGYTLPKGGIALMCSHITQRDPRFFAQPLRFRPARWDVPSVQPPGGIAYYPFGAGPYNCLGEGLGTALGTMVMAQLLRGWAFEAVPREPPVLRLVAIHSPGRIPVRVRPLAAG